MSCKEEVIRIGKKLEKMVSSSSQDHAQSLDLLNALKKQPMTLDVLQKTHIGMTVNNFRKSTSNDEVVTLAKSLIKSWKKLLPADSSQSSSQSSLSRSNSQASTSSRNEDEEKEDIADEDGGRGSSDAMKPPSMPPKVEQTTDGIRVKCRSMLTQALQEGGTPEGAPPAEDVAAAIEDCIFKEFESTSMKYKTRIRSRYANLKDAKNPTLRTNVLTGIIPPEKIAVMTAEDMANEDLKQLRDKFTKEAINDHQMAVTTGTKTDLLKCGKCGKRNCTYNQMQTRSADEPMTTFVFCNECGNRWKFC